jgi:hypothetical protein
VTNPEPHVDFAAAVAEFASLVRAMAVSDNEQMATAIRMWLGVYGEFPIDDNISALMTARMGAAAKFAAIAVHQIESLSGRPAAEIVDHIEQYLVEES